MSHSLYDTDRHEKRKSVEWQFFLRDLELVVAVKLCADQPQALKEVNDSKTFRQEQTILFYFSQRSTFSTGRFHLLQRMCAKRFA